MSETISKKKAYPYLRQFLDDAVARDPEQAVGAWVSSWGWMVALAATGIVHFLNRNLDMGLSGWIYVASFFGTLMLIEGPVKKLLTSAKRLTPVERSALPALRALNESHRGRKRGFDPARAGLELCASQWARVRQILASPAWSAHGVVGTWSQIGERSRKAADEAMLEAVLLAHPLLDLRTPSTAAALAPSSLSDQLARLGVQAESVGLDGLSAPEEAMLRPILDVGVHLKDLADQLERQTKDVGLRSTSDSSNIRQILGEIEAIRHAEHELDQHTS